MKNKLYTDIDVIDLLRIAVIKIGSQKKFADKHHISHTYINRVLNGGQRLGPAVLKALSLRRVFVYEEIPSLCKVPKLRWKGKKMEKPPEESAEHKARREYRIQQIETARKIRETNAKASKS